MNKIFNKILFPVAVIIMVATGCEKFLDRPTEDNYNVSNFYLNDNQCEQGVNYLYNSPWYDFQRGFFKIGEGMSGNMYIGGSPYLDFTANGTDVDLVNMSYSLWSVNGHCNTVIDNIKNANGPTVEGKQRYIGEALAWKAMAYFFMVRTFGAVPIVHNNTELLAGEYNKVEKVTRECVYDYIIMNLEKAIEFLPEDAYIGKYNRIDRFAAKGLLAKVYLTKAGLSGSINADDMAKAASYAKDVIDNSGRSLNPVYSDVFRLSPSVYNKTGECLISWLWKCGRDPWTQQNTFQSDLGMVGFGDQGDLWGGYLGPSICLQELFGIGPDELNPESPARIAADKDSRRKATMMLPGDVYEYFWADKGGFDYVRFLYDSEYGKGGPGELQCGTGSNNVKNLYGNDADHKAATGITPENMASQLPTHLLRLSDIYLIYAEAIFDKDKGEALRYVNMVRDRAGADPLTDLTKADIWKERRLEFAGEGDNWYDFVRRSYFQMNDVIAELKAQHRSTYNGLNDVYKYYFEKGKWDAKILPLNEKGEVIGYVEGAQRQVWRNVKEDAPNVTPESFTLPFPSEDEVFNHNMASTATPVTVDVRETYKYDFNF